MTSDSSRVKIESASSPRTREANDLDVLAELKKSNFKVSRIKHVFEGDEIYRQI